MLLRIDGAEETGQFAFGVLASAAHGCGRGLALAGDRVSVQSIPELELSFRALLNADLGVGAWLF